MMILFFLAVLCKDLMPLPLRVGRSGATPVNDPPGLELLPVNAPLFTFSFDFAEVTLLPPLSVSEAPTIEPAILCRFGVGKPRSFGSELRT